MRFSLSSSFKKLEHCSGGRQQGGLRTSPSPGQTPPACAPRTLRGSCGEASAAQLLGREEADWTQAAPPCHVLYPTAARGPVSHLPRRRNGGPEPQEAGGTWERRCHPPTGAWEVVLILRAVWTSQPPLQFTQTHCAKSLRIKQLRGISQENPTLTNPFATQNKTHPGPTPRAQT